MEKKMTKKEMFTAIREIVIDNQEMVNFIDHELELLNRKSSSKKPTKVQLENEKFKEVIMAHLTEVDTMLNINELQEQVTELENLSNQKITHLLSALVNEGKLNKEYIKKKPYYYIAR